MREKKIADREEYTKIQMTLQRITKCTMSSRSVLIEKNIAPPHKKNLEKEVKDTGKVPTHS